MSSLRCHQTWRLLGNPMFQWRFLAGNITEQNGDRSVSGVFGYVSWLLKIVHVCLWLIMFSIWCFWIWFKNVYDGLWLFEDIYDGYSCLFKVSYSQWLVVIDAYLSIGPWSDKVHNSIYYYTYKRYVDIYIYICIYRCKTLHTYTQIF